jgi:hypothetical protein
MALARKDRFKLKSQLLDEFDAHWSFDKLNLLFAEFGLETLDGDRFGPSTADVISTLSDTDLVDMYALVLDIDPREVADVVEASIEGRWKPGYARVFLSHSAKHREYVGQVATELAVVGVHGFVAHDTMEYSKPWQRQIEEALRSMQAFVALVHPEFDESAWCQQEAGWAKGRRVPIFAVRIGANPSAFLGSDQWPNDNGDDPERVAQILSSWISSLPELGDAVIGGLLNSLASAGNYMDAGATAARIAALGALAPEDFSRLDEIYWSNDQIHGGVLPTNELKPFYKANDRPWPPPKPRPTVDEEPF